LIFAICDLIFVGRLERKIANIKSQIENMNLPDYGLRTTDHVLLTFLKESAPALCLAGLPVFFAWR